jgi:hypothetical protein
MPAAAKPTALFTKGEMRLKTFLRPAGATSSQLFIETIIRIDGDVLLILPQLSSYNSPAFVAAANKHKQLVQQGLQRVRQYRLGLQAGISALFVGTGVAFYDGLLEIESLPEWLRVLTEAFRSSESFGRALIALLLPLVLGLAFRLVWRKLLQGVLGLVLRKWLWKKLKRKLTESWKS